MYDYQHALMDRAIFIPRIMTFECPVCPKEIQEKACIAEGKYCFYRPSQEVLDKNPELDVPKMIKEDLRARCVYDLAGNEFNVDDNHIFFNYLYNVHLECFKKDGSFKAHCS